MPVNIQFNSNIELEQNQTDNTQLYFIIPSYAIVVRNNQNTIFIYTTTNKESIAALAYVDILYNYNDGTSVVKCDSNALTRDSQIITSSDTDLYGGESVTTNPNNQESLSLNSYQ